MEIQYPTYYTYHTLSCSDKSVKLEINEWASVWCTLTHTIQLTFMSTRHPSDDATLIQQPAWVVFIHTEQH